MSVMLYEDTEFAKQELLQLIGEYPLPGLTQDRLPSPPQMTQDSA